MQSSYDVMRSAPGLRVDDRTAQWRARGGPEKWLDATRPNAGGYSLPLDWREPLDPRPDLYGSRPPLIRRTLAAILRPFPRLVERIRRRRRR